MTHRAFELAFAGAAIVALVALDATPTKAMWPGPNRGVGVSGSVYDEGYYHPRILLSDFNDSDHFEPYFGSFAGAVSGDCASPCCNMWVSAFANQSSTTEPIRTSGVTPISASGSAGGTIYNAFPCAYTYHSGLVYAISTFSAEGWLDTRHTFQLSGSVSFMDYGSADVSFSDARDVDIHDFADGSTADHTFSYSGTLAPGTWTLSASAGLQTLMYEPIFAGSGAFQVNLLLSPVPQPKLCGVFLGSDHLPFIRGQADAQALEAKFKHFTAWEKSSVLQFDYSLRGDSGKSAVFSELQSYESLMQAGDTFIFFYSGHGGGGTGVDEWLAINRDQTGPSDDYQRKITDDDLASWFLSEELVGGRRRRDIWENVNKLFILDACHAGGFVGGSDDIVGEEDLMGLPHTAILAACDEDGEAYAREDGRGEFTVAVEEALILVNGYAQADSNRDGLTFDELAVYLQQYVYGVTYFDGRIKMDPAGDDLELVHASLSLFSWKSDDFDGVIPEPATLSLLALGGTGMLLRRRALGR